MTTLLEAVEKAMKQAQEARDALIDTERRLADQELRFKGQIGQLTQKIRELEDNVVTKNLTVTERVGIGTDDPQDALDVRGGIIVTGNATVTGEITEGGKKLKEKYQPKGDYQPKGNYQPAGNYQPKGRYHEKGDSIDVATDDTGNGTTASAKLQIVGTNGIDGEPGVAPGVRIRITGPTSDVVTSGFRIDRAGTTLLAVNHGGDLHIPGGSLKLGDVTIEVKTQNDKVVGIVLTKAGQAPVTIS